MGVGGSPLPTSVKVLQIGMCDSPVDPETVKQASGILQRILNEEPEFWPYGLSVDQFDGGLYLLSKQASSKDFVGFVGWQERDEEGKRVGYYAIGVLPEYRRQGLAKAAVQKLLMEKSAGVDEVRALVMAQNAPSQELARAIPGVRLTVMEKLAALEKSALQPGTLRQIAGMLAGAAGSTAFFDQTGNPDRTLASTFNPGEWDKQRKLMGLFNAGLGALGGQQVALGTMRGNPDALKNLTAGIGSFALAPAKDLMLKGQDTLTKADPILKALANRPQPKSLGDMISKPMVYGALGIGAGGLGLAAYSSLMKARAAKEQAAAARGGRVRVTLPTKEEGDAETFLDMPLEEINLSNALKSRLGRDTRKRLLEETRKRTTKRKPKDPNAPTALEQSRAQEAAQLEEEERNLDKAAAAGPQPAVPSPPGPGNPALRQTQQSAAANSIDTSTAANPQIMKAQQDAASASMDAQNQVAQAEQKTQQQLNEQQQGFQQQLQKADQDKQSVAQENQMLKMKVEQSKVEADLLKSKFKAKEELAKVQSDATASKGEAHDSQLNRLIGSRLDRVQSKMASSSELVSPWGVEVDTLRNPAKSWEIDAVTGQKAEGQDLNPETGKPNPPPIKSLRPNTAQGINDNGAEYMAQGRAPSTHLYRASYGGIGDTLYKYMLQPYLTTPPAPGGLNALGNLRRYGAQFMNSPQF